jgi:hypothetical protein
VNQLPESREPPESAHGPTQVLDPTTAVLQRTLAYSRNRDYTGWDYADGMSSRVLDLLPFESKWTNIAVQETVKRSPVNLRRLFHVEQRRNFKGTALFVRANLNAYDLTGEEIYRTEAADLADWLCENKSTEVPEFAGCHRHDLQGLDSLTPAGTPGVVGTAYGVQALLAAGEAIDDSYTEVAHTAGDFVLERLGYEELETGARINYRPTESDEYYTLNANALGARILLDLHEDRPNERYLAAARRILDYVVSKQTAIGGWMYRDPPTASHLSMDNHHNGFIVETLLRYREVVGDGRYETALAESLRFYRERLFEPDGAPNWDESASYPRDVHAAAQGILVFTAAGDRDLAARIVEWTLGHLYAGDGRFYYRKERFYTKRITLMRWGQAWMAYALSAFRTADVVASVEVDE